jgi:hypothetical protein
VHQEPRDVGTGSARGHEPQIVEYLKTLPSEAELTATRKLGIKPLELDPPQRAGVQGQVRGQNTRRQGLIKAMVGSDSDPATDRGRGDAAAIGRPPQDVERLLR